MVTRYSDFKCGKFHYESVFNVYQDDGFGNWILVHSCHDDFIIDFVNEDLH